MSHLDAVLEPVAFSAEGAELLTRAAYALLD